MAKTKTPALPKSKQRRKDWGTQNMVEPKPSNPALDRVEFNELRQRNVQLKLQTFFNTAIYPQQLTIPRQYATTELGTFICKTFKGRKLDGVVEDGVCVVVQENAKNARFIMSPLFQHEQDARDWAVNQTAARIL